MYNDTRPSFPIPITIFQLPTSLIISSTHYFTHPSRPGDIIVTKSRLSIRELFYQMYRLREIHHKWPFLSGVRTLAGALLGRPGRRRRVCGHSHTLSCSAVLCSMEPEIGSAVGRGRAEIALRRSGTRSVYAECVVCARLHVTGGRKIDETSGGATRCPGDIILSEVRPYFRTLKSGSKLMIAGVYQIKGMLEICT